MVALVIAALQLATVELRVRAARRERHELGRQLDDVRKKVGADRRAADRR